MSTGKRNQAPHLKIVESTPLITDINDFLAACRARNLSLNTIRIYRANLQTFSNWTACRQADDLTARDIRAYLVHLQEQGHNSGGVHQAYRVLKTFFRWLLNDGSIERNPMATIKAPKLDQSPLEPLPLADLQAMLATCDKSPIGQRDRAIMLCLLDTGCRASEFIALDVVDVNMNTGSVIVKHGKGGKPHSVFLGAKALRQLRKYLRSRNSGPLWLTKPGNRLTYDGLREIVRRRASAAGVPVPALHSFRRAFALMSLRAGMDVYSLQRLMGHADLSVLRRYLAQTEDDLREAHQKAGVVDRWI